MSTQAHLRALRRKGRVGKMRRLRFLLGRLCLGRFVGNRADSTDRGCSFDAKSEKSETRSKEDSRRREKGIRIETFDQTRAGVRLAVAAVLKGLSSRTRITSRRAGVCEFTRCVATGHQFRSATNPSRVAPKQ